MSYARIAYILESNDEVVVLDGGMGTVLASRGVASVENPNIWSVPALLDAPLEVIRAHQDYGLARADVLTALAFRTGPTALRKGGLDKLSRPLTQLAIGLAEEARRSLLDFNTGRPMPAIAGNMTSIEDTFVPSKSPGSWSFSEHAEKAQYLAEAGCDFILIESVPSLEEASVAVAAAGPTGKHVWLSVVLAPVSTVSSSPDNARMLDGTPVADIPVLLQDMPVQPDALLFNCCMPEAITLALQVIGDRIPVPFGAYANVGEPTSDEHAPWVRRPDITPDRYADMVAEWCESGARIVGGCCGTTPDDIKAIRRRLSRGSPMKVGRARSATLAA